MVRRVLWPWNAAALQEIMAGAVQESKRGAPELRPDGRAVGQQLGGLPLALLLREGLGLSSSN